MALSDKEIADLLDKAESFMEARKGTSDDLKYLQQALDCYNRIIENAPPHPAYFAKRADIKHIMLHKASFLSFDIQSVIEDISRAIELDIDKGEYYRRRGFYLSYSLQSVNEKEKAELIKKINEDYTTCLTKDPSNSDVWLSLIANNVLLNDWDEAISRYGEARPFVIDRQDQLTRAWLGCLALALAGDPIEEEDKKPLYDQSIEGKYDPNITSAVNNLLNKIKEKDGDEQKWKRAIEIHDLFINHLDWNTRGTKFHDLKRYEEAIEAFKKAIGLKPVDPMLWRNIGISFGKLGRHEEALKAFDKSLKLSTDAATWLNKRDVLLKLGRYEEAYKAFDKGIELIPDDKKCFSALGFAENFAELGRYDEAFKALDKAIALAPENMKWAAAIGFANKLAELDRYEEAYKTLDKAIALAPNEMKSSVESVFAEKLAKLDGYNDRIDDMLKKLASKDEASFEYNKTKEHGPNNSQT